MRDFNRYSPWLSRTASNGSRFNIPSGAMMSLVAVFASAIGSRSARNRRFEASIPAPFARTSSTNCCTSFSTSLRPTGSACMCAPRRVTEIQKEVGSSSTYSKSASSGCRSFSTFVNAAGCTERRWLGASSLVHARPRSPLVFNEVVEQLCAFRLRCWSASVGPGDRQHRLPAWLPALIPLTGNAFSVFKSPSESSASNTFQNCERSGRIAILGDEFKVSQVGLTHRRSNGAIPVRLIDAEEHSLNHIFRLFVESVCFGKATTTRLQISEHRQIARHVITITNLLAGSQTLGGTRVRCGQISAITIECR